MKNFAIILSGGVGARMKSGDIPKQYITVAGKPILMYAIDPFEQSADVDSVIIVASEQWQQSIAEWIKKYNITKFGGFAYAGETRQHSLINGLRVCLGLSDDPKDKVIIHDAARPLVSTRLISDCVSALDSADGCLPVLPVKDTIYVSNNGETITGLLERNTLYAGQSPESFYLRQYAALNENLSDLDISQITGTSALAFANRLSVKLIRGDENNYKITTISDLEKFKRHIQENS